MPQTNLHNLSIEICECANDKYGYMVIPGLTVIPPQCVLHVQTLCIHKPKKQSQQKKLKLKKTELATKLEQVLSKKGRLYLKDFFYAGMISGQNSINITVRALVVCEPSREGEKIRGLIIEFLEGAKLEKINSSFLEIEECESLLKAIIDKGLSMVKK